MVPLLNVSVPDCVKYQLFFLLKLIFFIFLKKLNCIIISLFLSYYFLSLAFLLFLINVCLQSLKNFQIIECNTPHFPATS